MMAETAGRARTGYGGGTMFQFGEILTLGLGTVAAIYLLTNRGDIARLPPLRVLVIPFILMAVAWVATVLEGIPGGGAPTIVFLQGSATIAHQGGLASELLNVVEHLAYTATAVALLVGLWRARRPEQEGTS